MVGTFGLGTGRKIKKEGKMSYRKIFKDEINYLLFLLTVSAEAQISVAIELPLIVQVMLLGIILYIFIISLTRVTIKRGKS